MKVRNFGEVQEYFKNNFRYVDITNQRCFGVLSSDNIFYRFSAFYNIIKNSVSFYAWILYIPDKDVPAVEAYSFDDEFDMNEVKLKLIKEMDKQFTGYSEKQKWATISNNSFAMRKALWKVVEGPFSIIRNENWFSYNQKGAAYRCYARICDRSQIMELFMWDCENRPVHITLSPYEVHNIEKYLDKMADALLTIKHRI